MANRSRQDSIESTGWKMIKKQLVLFLALAIGAVVGLGGASPRVAAAAAGCHDGLQSSGAVYRICMPASWNGSLVLYAHGFVDPTRAVGIPEDQMQLPDGTT